MTEIRRKAIERGWIVPAAARARCDDGGPTPQSPSDRPVLQLDRFAREAIEQERRQRLEGRRR